MQNYFDNEATSSALHATMKPARGGKCLVTLSTYEDRKEALLNTTIMEDAGTYRSKISKINPAQNDSRDSSDSKQESQIHIPKPPPPLQPMANINGAHKYNNNSKENNNNNNNNAQNATPSVDIHNNKRLVINDPAFAGSRLSNSSQNSNSSAHNGSSDAYNRPNKTPITNNASNVNRQTLRLGTVTIGEYRQQTLRREPEKFDFISTQKKGRDSGDTTPTNEALQNELQNTLSRANLQKSNGNPYTEHQRNCPLHQQQQQLQRRQSSDQATNVYDVDEMSKKLQKATLNETATTEQLLAKTNNNRAVNGTTGSIGFGGILKNGSRNATTGSSSKSSEKSIKFG